MREKGDVLEDYILETWPEPIHKEPNSGARNNQNDLVTPSFSIECKRKLTQSSISLSGKEIKNCTRKAKARQKLPAWVVESTCGTYVVMRYADFIHELWEDDGQKEEEENS